MLTLHPPCVFRSQLCFWRRLNSGFKRVSDCRHVTLQCCIDQHHFEVHHGWCRREEVFVSVQWLLAVRSTSCQVFGGCVGAWRDFDDDLFHFPEFLLVLRCASATALDVVVSSHSAISAASRRIWISTRSTSAFAGDVVVLASHAFVLRQIVLSRFAMSFWLGPIKMGSRSLRTFSGIPRVTGVGFHGSQTMAFNRAVSQRRLSTLRFDARLRTMPFVWFSDQTLIVFAFTSEPHVFAPC